jgi:hypothetical protein
MGHALPGRTGGARCPARRVGEPGQRRGNVGRSGDLVEVEDDQAVVAEIRPLPQLAVYLPVQVFQPFPLQDGAQAALIGGDEENEAGLRFQLTPARVPTAG